jgi:patatin-like phospholipase/acyl hydrolase
MSPASRDILLQHTDLSLSTGGLIALGLASKDWTVEQCIYHFTELCEKAFTRRVGINIPGMSMIIESLHHSKYETAPLQQALQQAFSKDDFLFGGPRMTNHRTKVAVTATNSGTVSVLANYNRNCVDKRKFPFTLKRIH